MGGIRGRYLAEICGERWSRLLSPTLAAAYCGMTLNEWKKTRFATLIRLYDGRERVDRFEINAMIDAMNEEQEQRAGKVLQRCNEE